MDYLITKRERDGDGYFTVRWSPLIKADKYDIHRNVPAVGGIVELYHKDEKGHLVLFGIHRSWFGGLRAVLRQTTDPEEEKSAPRKALLEAHKGRIYYRYAICSDLGDMDDVLFFLFETLGQGTNPVDHSGRYDHIWLEEVDAS